MNKAILICTILALFKCNPSKNKADLPSGDTDSPDQWIVLFDGKNTDHWRGAHLNHFPGTGWSVSGGELLNDGTGKGNLVSRSQYSNFILEWEWRLFDEGGNSGLKYFVKETADENGKRALGLEYQMLDDERHVWMKEGKMKPNDYHTTGALYEFFPPSDNKKMVPLGEFNRSKIVSDGHCVEHWLNGEKVVEYERGGVLFLEMKAKSKFKDLPEFGLHGQGHILLQDHQSRVGFKNIRIKILDNNS